MHNLTLHRLITPCPLRPKGYCRCLRLSVHLSVRKLLLVRMITRDRFKLESPNLHQTYMHHGIVSELLNIEIIDLDFQGHFCHFLYDHCAHCIATTEHVMWLITWRSCIFTKKKSWLNIICLQHSGLHIDQYQNVIYSPPGLLTPQPPC